MGCPVPRSPSLSPVAAQPHLLRVHLLREAQLITQRHKIYDRGDAGVALTELTHEHDGLVGADGGVRNFLEPHFPAT